MKNALSIAVLALTCVGSSLASDTLVTTGSWYAGVAPANSGGPFWDNTSSDGTNCNVGFVLNGTALSCGGKVPVAPSVGFGIPNANLPFLASNSGQGTAASFSFNNGGSTNSGFVASLAGDTTSTDPLATETFGWADGAGHSGTLFTLHSSMVNGSSNTPGAMNFTPTGNFWFVLTVTSPDSTYDATYTTSGSGSQFALFAPAPPASAGNPANGTALTDFWLGMDDVTAAHGSDRDYQDVVVEIQSLGSSVGTPEPGFYGLLAAGMVAVGLFARRRQRKIAA